MLDEIKLRAWDEMNKKMWYSNEVGESLGEWTFQLYFDDDGILRAIIYREIDVGFVQKDCQEHQLPIMMYTGIKDKNGRDIYEGDIISFAVFDYNGADTQYTGVIKYCGSRFMIWHDNEQEFYGSDGAFDLDWVLLQDDELTIIGNIHDNPELLEGKRMEG